ncbi:hypothetical protein Salat_2291500 [Sesamum alatum]|uniref:Uncharacterized protein n=1 Tax=Sesamum alatum TaxID=300844 RepID=A0AAE2CE53_9LAMI|nr:hypothetical protein Salat_2291500 [Sesamum alatum]
MWAALSLQPPKPWPPNALSTTKLPPPRHSVTIANLQNGDGITALDSNKPQHRNATKSGIPEKQELEERQKQKQKQKQLSGADILMALERATADKAKKKKDKRNTFRGGRNNAKQEETSSFSTDVRPLCIKPEWSGRLEELETTLQQLVHTHGHT